MTTADLLLLICRICEPLKPDATWTEKLLVASVILDAEKRKTNVVDFKKVEGGR